MKTKKSLFVNTVSRGVFLNLEICVPNLEINTEQNLILQVRILVAPDL